MRTSVKVKTAPSTMPIALIELKAAAKVTTCDDDDFLIGVIKSATDGLQRWTNRYFINHTLTLFRDTLYEEDCGLSGRKNISIGHVSTYRDQQEYFNVPHVPIQSVTFIKTYNLQNVATVFDSSNYSVDSTNGKIWLNEGKSWPYEIRQHQGIEVEYVSGFGPNPSDVPPALRDAIKMYALQMYECRGGCEMSDACKSLARYYKNLDMLGWD